MQLAHFRDLFKVIMRESQKRHFTVVFDEFQNLYKVNPAIFSEIQDIWDRLQRKVENLPASEFRRYKLELRALSMDDM